MHERRIVGRTSPGLPEVPSYAGVECIFSTANTDSNTNSNSNTNILITVGPRALTYVKAVSRLRWERPYCNGSRLLRYKVTIISLSSLSLSSLSSLSSLLLYQLQKRYIIAANPNPYTNTNTNAADSITVIPNDGLERIALVKGFIIIIITIIITITTIRIMENRYTTTEHCHQLHRHRPPPQRDRRRHRLHY